MEGRDGIAKEEGLYRTGLYRTGLSLNHAMHMQPVLMYINLAPFRIRSQIMHARPRDYVTSELLHRSRPPNIRSLSWQQLDRRLLPVRELLHHL